MKKNPLNLLYLLNPIVSSSLENTEKEETIMKQFIDYIATVTIVFKCKQTVAVNIAAIPMPCRVTKLQEIFVRRQTTVSCRLFKIQC